MCYQLWLRSQAQPLNLQRAETPIRKLATTNARISRKLRAQERCRERQLRPKLGTNRFHLFLAQEIQSSPMRIAATPTKRGPRRFVQSGFGEVEEREVERRTLLPVSPQHRQIPIVWILQVRSARPSHWTSGIGVVGKYPRSKS